MATSTEFPQWGQIDLWGCVDCLFAIANGDFPEDPERAEEVREGIRRNGGRVGIGHFHGVDYCGREHGEDYDEQTECETQDFSWTPCHLCGSTLGGSRHALHV